MQIVFLGDNLHEMSKPIYLENKKTITNLSFDELVQKVVKVNQTFIFLLRASFLRPSFFHFKQNYFFHFAIACYV